MLDVGLAMLLEHGYHGLGIQAVLEAARAPKGSFYHHFVDKEDFALQVIDQYMAAVHVGLDACLGATDRSPLARARFFFEMTQESYGREGYLGCLLGGLGQELSGASDVFRLRIEQCLSYIAERIGGSLEEARRAGELPASTDTAHLANLLVDCWEGAALRSRVRGEPSSLTAMLDFFFRAATATG